MNAQRPAIIATSITNLAGLPDNLYRWDTEDRRAYTYTVTHDGKVYTARITRDLNAERPDSSFGPVVLSVERGTYASVLSPKSDSECLETALDFYVGRYLSGQSVEVFTRYARAFRGADVYTFGATTHRSPTEYVVITTPTQYRERGNVGPVSTGAARIDAYEWEAWVDGDVYRIDIECDGQEIDALHGVFGDDYAVETAAEMILYCI